MFAGWQVPQEKLFVHIDGGASWSVVNSGIIDTQDIRVFKGVSNQIAFASTTPPDTTFIYRTTDGGLLWTKVFSQYRGSIDGIKMFNQTKGIALGEPIDGKWTIVKTTNGGETWNAVATQPPQIDSAKTGRSFGTYDNNYVWFFDSHDRFYYSGDGGESWGNIHWSIPDGPWLLWRNCSSCQLAVGPTWSWYWSNYSGWTISGPVPNISIIPTGLVGALGTREYWLTQDTLYYTSNDGSTWTSESPNGLAKHTTLIDMVTLGSEVSAWATGVGDTIYHYHRIPTGVKKLPQQIPLEFSLSQNYPNPFNPSTSIRFDIPVSSLVSINVYNVLGQEVTTLVNEDYKPGNYEVTWDAKDLSSGVYYYRLQAGSFMETKKLVLLR
jgi:hypothetical protein